MLERTETSPLVQAIHENNLNSVQTLLRHDANNPATLDSLGRTALHHAAFQGNIEIIKVLLVENSAILDQKEQGEGKKNGLTPLHITIMRNKTGAAQYLLDQGSDPAIQDNRGWNALHHAVFVDNAPIISLLAKDHPALLDVKTNRGKTPFQVTLEQETNKSLIFDSWLPIGNSLATTVVTQMQGTSVFSPSAKGKKREDLAVRIAQQLSGTYNSMRELAVDIGIGETTHTNLVLNIGSTMADNQSIRENIRKCLITRDSKSIVAPLTHWKSYTLSTSDIPTHLSKISIQQCFTQHANAVST